MEESYLCLGQCHLVVVMVVVVCVCVILLLPQTGVFTKFKTTTKKRELCKSACRILVKIKITENHISKTHHTQLLSKARH